MNGNEALITYSDVLNDQQCDSKYKETSGCECQTELDRSSVSYAAESATIHDYLAVTGLTKPCSDTSMLSKVQ